MDEKSNILLYYLIEIKVEMETNVQNADSFVHIKCKQNAVRFMVYMYT